MDENYSHFFLSCKGIYISHKHKIRGNLNVKINSFILLLWSTSFNENEAWLSVKVTVQYAQQQKNEQRAGTHQQKQRCEIGLKSNPVQEDLQHRDTTEVWMVSSLWICHHVKTRKEEGARQRQCYSSVMSTTCSIPFPFIKSYFSNLPLS